jgi:hypothetical protein
MSNSNSAFSYGSSLGREMLILKRALLGDEAAPASLSFNVSETWGGGADIHIRMRSICITKRPLYAIARVFIYLEFLTTVAMQYDNDRFEHSKTPEQCFVKPFSNQPRPNPIYSSTLFYLRLKRVLPSIFFNLLSLSSELITAFLLPSATVCP